MAFWWFDCGEMRGNDGLLNDAFGPTANMQKFELYLPLAVEIAINALPMPLLH